ncbi:MAG: aminotransferase class III-fold pyridoxal phosphate-dependent enzyme, partial [Saprospirales bacterium]|nr:aminotransferase class III-fold pyridoxal phosphate-dependent enzyme [Saprospirales bacterium]
MNMLSRAEGAYLYDWDGNKFLDLHGNGVHNIEFNNPVVIEAIKQQLDEGLSFSPRRYTNAPAIGLAKKLVEMAPEGLNRVLFAPGGSEAIEMAILLAKMITGKWKTISFWDNYHGTTWQAATVGGTEHFSNGAGPMVPGAFHVEFPNYYRNPWGLTDQEQIDDLYIRQIEVILARHPDSQLSSGRRLPPLPLFPTYFWQRVQDFCRRHDAFLIFDEVICGLGRSGKFFACEHYVT